MEEFFVLVIVIILVAIMIFTGGIFAVVDAIWGYDIEEEVIQCTIVHMDIDNESHFITVVNNDFSKTIEVDENVYANYKVNEQIIVYKRGHYDPNNRTIYRYDIE